MGRGTLRSRIFLVFAVVSAAAAIALLATPATISSPVHEREVVVVFAGLALVLLLTLLLLRRALASLERLATLMRQVDPLSLGSRIPVYGDVPEVVDLTNAFNDMLVRLAVERRRSIRRSLDAQDSERLRIAQELHDEVGQSLTAILLQLEQVRRQLPADVQPRLEEVRDSARSSLEDVRGIARRLRPEALEDLGLASALAALCRRLSDKTGSQVGCEVERDLPALEHQSELAVYRVAQEAITNALRHSGAAHIDVRLEAHDASRAALLTVTDDGSGLDGHEPGAGIQGMRERALLVGGSLHIGPRLGSGTRVTLRVPGKVPEP